MAVDGSLIFDTRIDTKGFTSGTNTIKNQANGLKSTFASLGKVIAGAFILKKTVDIGKQALDIASDLQEVQNVVDVAFGSMSDKMEKFAKTAIESFGISELAAKQTGSIFMAMGKGMDIASESASEMAISLTGLSADMASFYNVSQDIASTALKSIYTGETETLKQFGVVMTEANLQNFALSQGIKKTVSEMNQAEKVQLRYNFVMKQTALAQGDFARTSDSWANQTRILKEQWKEFLGIIGNGLIQVLSPAIKFLNTAMSYLISMAKTVSEVLNAVFGTSVDISTSTASIADSTADAATGYTEMGDAAEKAGKQANKAIAPFDKLNQASSESSSTGDVGAIGGGVPTVDIEDAKVTTEVNNDIANSFKNLEVAIKPTRVALTKLRDTLKPIAKFAFDNLKSLYNDILVPMGKWVLGEGLPGLIDAFNNMLSDVDWLKLTKAIEKFNKAIAPFAMAIGQGFIDFITDLSGFLKPVVATTADILADAIERIADVLEDIDPASTRNIGYALGIVGTALTGIKIVKGLSDFLLGVGGGLASLATGLMGFASLNPLAFVVVFNDLLYEIEEAIWGIMPQWAKDLWTGFWDLIIKAFETWFNFDYAYGIFEKMVATFKEAFAGDKEWYEIGLNIILGILQGIYGAFSFITEPIVDFLYALIDSICDVFGINSPAKEMEPYGEYILLGVLEGFKNTFASWWTSVETWGRQTKEKFGTWAGTIWGAVKTAFKDVGTWFKTKFETAWSNIKKVFAPFSGFFQGLWDGIKTGFSGALWALKDLAKGPINAVIGILNTLIGAMNKISFDIPGWVPGGLGGKSFGFNMTKIPKLATGTVVPANYGEFLSILGDSRHPEIVSPIPDMKQAFKEAFAEMGGSGAGTINLNVYLEGKQIHSEVVRQDKQYRKETGKSAFAY